MAAKSGLRLRVARAMQQDVGKGICRIGRAHIEALGLGQANIVEIKGQRSTAAIVVPSLDSLDQFDQRAFEMA